MKNEKYNIMLAIELILFQLFAIDTRSEFMLGKKWNIIFLQRKRKQEDEIKIKIKIKYTTEKYG